MTRKISKYTLITVAFIFLMSAFISCNSETKTATKTASKATTENEVVPDSIVQFLIASAANDFRNHQPPTPLDFRNVKIGYITSSNNERIFLLCGEFLSKENNEWVEFTTIKTSGYEQYLGKTQYCQDATMVLTDENLLVGLKAKFTE
jgi:hypothetical protein